MSDQLDRFALDFLQPPVPFAQIARRRRDRGQEPPWFLAPLLRRQHERVGQSVDHRRAQPGRFSLL